MREAQLLQKGRHMTLVIVDPEAFLDDPLEIDTPPAHHPVDGGVRPGFDNLGQLCQLLGRKPWLGATIPGVLEPFRPGFVETMHPVAQGLPVHPANPGGVRSAHTLKHRRQRKQTAALPRIL
jgi:hypothetical protein